MSIFFLLLVLVASVVSDEMPEHCRNLEQIESDAFIAARKTCGEKFPDAKDEQAYMCIDKCLFQDLKMLDNDNYIIPEKAGDVFFPGEEKKAARAFFIEKLKTCNEDEKKEPANKEDAKNECYMHFSPMLCAQDTFEEECKPYYQSKDA